VKSLVHNRKYEHCKRKKWMRTLLISRRKSCCIQGGRDRVFTDERLWSSAEFVVGVIAWFVHRSVHCDQDYCKVLVALPTQAQRSRRSSPLLRRSLCLGCPSRRNLWAQRRLFRELTANPDPHVFTKRRAVGHAQCGCHRSLEQVFALQQPCPS
jgi:hypothetical protein